MSVVNYLDSKLGRSLKCARSLLSSQAKIQLVLALANSFAMPFMKFEFSCQAQFVRAVMLQTVYN